MADDQAAGWCTKPTEDQLQAERAEVTTTEARAAERDRIAREVLNAFAELEGERTISDERWSAIASAPARQSRAVRIAFATADRILEARRG